ncbi:hypothetical protein ACWT_5521 [Actinoplanes sp. SE50]|uniref:hypothetical protein n=1 Tax=unclassified Actinoplanes TaxID=2626549 RepID=UPI00023ECB8D|nr:MULTISPECIES: hypothetical protein [unclassified Actinoplanes]AEV86538.1 hypothetical protein ACPL_5651 [Actinoplanes sp. SE50/110]ATO84936.1 hypothetical protein ACWT_5521 [Actinoplanes sp. SE50]SLM02345.1 hypothetical protein ACSP50_5584 [Actinoplanes sp. SE50/110]
MTDWDRFRHEISWFLDDGQTATVGDPQPWDREPVDGLPVLSALLATATRTPVTVDDDHFELLAWGPPAERRGWLCRPPRAEADLTVPRVHRDFWAVCGGLVERFGEPSSWWENQNEVLTAQAAAEPVEGPFDAYAWIWEGATPLEPRDHYPVAVEANGNLTLARRTDGRLLLFAPDHAFDGVTAIADGLLTIDGVPDLATWIEVCATAWLPE